MDLLGWVLFCCMTTIVWTRLFTAIAWVREWWGDILSVGLGSIGMRYHDES